MRIVDSVINLPHTSSAKVHSDDKNGETLRSAVKPIVEATRGLKKIKPIELEGRRFLLPRDIRSQILI